MKTRLKPQDSLTYSHLEDIEDLLPEIYQNNPWIQELAELAPLPKQYQLASHHTLAAITAAICAIGASLPYIDGGATLGLPYIIGGVSVNGIQNLMYSGETYFFLKECFGNFRARYGIFFLSILIATLASLPPGISEYQVANNSAIKMLLTFLGNYPSNIFGMFLAIIRIDNARQDSFYRNLLLEQFKLSLKPYPEINSHFLSVSSPGLDKVAKFFGIATGLWLVLGMTGYTCSSADFNSLYIGNAAGILFGVIMVIPNAAIGFVYAGLDFSKITINSLVELYKQTSLLSPREKKYLLASTLLIGTTTYLSFYSSAVSIILYDQYCPKSLFGNILNSILNEAVNYGMILFSIIMTGVSIKSGINYILHAYAEGLDKVKYQLTNIEEWLHQERHDEIKKFALTHFTNECIEHQNQPASQNRFSYFTKKIPIQEPDKEQKRKCCVIL